MNYIEKYIGSVLSYMSYMDMKTKSENLINRDIQEDADLQVFLRVYKNFIYKGNGIQDTDVTKFDEKIKNKTASIDDIKIFEKVEYEYNNGVASITFFANNFIITDQIVHYGWDGFSAISYKLKNDIPGTNYKAGQIFVSYRGTEPSNYGDFITDFGLTFSDRAADSRVNLFLEKYIKSPSQETQAKDFLVKTLLENPGNNIYITGHSLGGYLATRTLYSLYEDKDKNIQSLYQRIIGVNTFNSAGLSILDGFMIKDPFPLAGKVENIFSYRGMNVTSANVSEIFSKTIITTFQHLGKRIPSYAENDSMMGNHSVFLLMQSMGFMAVLTNLFSNIDSIKDASGKTLLGDDAIVYAANKLLMSTYDKSRDLGYTLSTTAQRLLDLFNIKDNTYVSNISTLLDYIDYFEEHQEFKLKLIENHEYTSNQVDSNTNRSLMYSLINNMGYYAVVPDSFNQGIYDRSSTSIDNQLYNIENYSATYLEYRSLFNQVYLYYLENKLADVVDFDRLDMNNIYFNNMNYGGNKIVFIEQVSSVQTDTLYINTTREESSDPDSHIQHVYFKQPFPQDIEIKSDNAIVFDTISNDIINVTGNNIQLYSMGGDDFFFIKGADSKNIQLFDTNLKGHIYIKNYSTQADSLQIFIKKDTSQLVFHYHQLPESSNIEITWGEEGSIKIDGSLATLRLNDNVVDYRYLEALFSNFKELYSSANGYGIIVDNAFIDSYITATRNQFKLIGFDRTGNGYISSEHAQFINDKIAHYGQSVSGVDIQSLQNHVNSLIYNEKIVENTSHPILDTALIQITDQLNDPLIRERTQEVFNKFNASQYNHSATEEIDNISRFSSMVAANIYHKKETKNYILKNYTREDGSSYQSYEWDGIYYLNRAVNGVQVASFYDSKIEGNIMNYYQTDKLSYDTNSDLFQVQSLARSMAAGDEGTTYQNVANVFDNLYTYASKEGTLYGSDGSDILIGNGYVYGQSDYYGDSGSQVIDKAGTKNNGNDILIGDNVRAYSGDNFLYGQYLVDGGRGNDVIFGSKRTNQVYTNFDYKNDQENSNTVNYVFYRSSGRFYSSNGSNKFIDISEEAVSPYFYLTGGDTLIGGIGHSYIIGSASALGLKEKFSYLGVSFDGDVVDFYNYYQGQQANRIVSGTGGIDALLGINDTVDLSKGQSTVWGAGNNQMVLGESSTVYSGGHSQIDVQGSYNKIYLGEADTYQFSNAHHNQLYSREYENTGVKNVDYYSLQGYANDLHLGLGQYKVDLKGDLSSVYLDKSSNNVAINSYETGKNTIYFNNAYIRDVVVNKYTKGDLSFLSNAGGHIQIDNFKIDAQGNINLYGFDYSVKNMEIVHHDRLSFFSYGQDVDYLKLVSYGEVNLTSLKISVLEMALEKAVDVKLISLNNVERLTLTSNRSPSTIFISSDISTLSMKNQDSETKVALSGNYTNTYIEGGILSGYGYQVSSFHFEGKVDYFTLQGNAADVFIRGSINHMSLDNISNFTYHRDYNEKPSLFYKGVIEITNSTISHLSELDYLSVNLKNSRVEDINNSVDSYFSLTNSKVNYMIFDMGNIQVVAQENSEIGTIRTTGQTLSVSNYRSIINTIEAEVSGSVSLSTDNDSTIREIDITSGGMSISGRYLTGVNGFLGTAGSFSNLYVNSADRLSVSGKVSLSGKTMGILNLIAGNIVLSNFNHIDTLYINTDKVIMTSPLNSNNIDNVTLTGTQSLKMYRNNGYYYFNDMAFSDVPTMVVITGHQYSREELSDLFSRLSQSGSYAMLTENGVGTIVGESEPEEPGEGPYIDEKGIYQGTDGDDTYNLDSRSYHLNGGKGDDTFNFNQYNPAGTIMDYREGDGTDTINVNAYNMLAINLEFVTSEQLSYRGESNMYGQLSKVYIMKDNTVLFIINHYEQLNLTLNLMDKVIRSSDIEASILGIDGTEGDDVINGFSNSNSYILAGKGDDTINLTTGYNNYVYYRVGDGRDTINAFNFSRYTIQFDDMDSSKVSYEKTQNGGINIKYDNESIITVNQPDNASLAFSNSFNYVSLSSVYRELSTVYGTSESELIEVGGGSYVYSREGNDTIKLNYTATDSQTQIYYSIGDGYDTVILSPESPNRVGINLGYPLTSDKLKFEYDIHDHDSLNIYYRENEANGYEKILTIQHYNQDEPARATIIAGFNIISPNAISEQAESNYQSAMQIETMAIKASAGVQKMIEVMASYDSSSDTSYSSATYLTSSDHLDKQQ